MHITYIVPHNKIQTQCGAVMSFLHYYLKKAGWVGGGGGVGGVHALAQECKHACICLSDVCVVCACVREQENKSDGQNRLLEETDWKQTR